MNSERRMVGEIMLKEIERIGEIKKEGIVIECNEKEIAKFLDVKYLLEKNLVELRNLLVETLGERIDGLMDTIELNRRMGWKERADKYYDRIEMEHALMTVVCGIIDKEIRKEKFDIM